jgi:hypothetical protein
MKSLEINQALLIALSAAFLLGLGSAPLIGLAAIVASLSAFRAFLSYKGLNDGDRAELKRLKADIEILNNKLSSVENKVSASGLRRSI